MQYLVKANNSRNGIWNQVGLNITANSPEIAWGADFSFGYFLLVLAFAFSVEGAEEVDVVHLSVIVMTLNVDSGCFISTVAIGSVGPEGPNGPDGPETVIIKFILNYVLMWYKFGS